MKKITFKCPNCWTVYEVDAKFEEALKNKKNCKFCLRKDPNIPTTAEMDGLETKEDMRDRHTVVFQCRSCKKWTIHRDYLINKVSLPCSGCGEVNYDPTSLKSLRTYNPLTDNKRKPK